MAGAGTKMPGVRHGLMGSCSSAEPDESHISGMKVTLENEELWRQFSGVTNEMIVTKAGRYRLQAKYNNRCDAIMHGPACMHAL